MAILGSFNSACIGIKAYIREYAGMIVKDTVKSKSIAIPEVLYLYRMVKKGRSTGEKGTDELIKGFKEAELLTCFDKLIEEIQEKLSDVNTEGLLEKISNDIEKSFDKQTVTEFAEMLKLAQEDFIKKHPGHKILSGLFDSFKGLFKK